MLDECNLKMMSNNIFLKSESGEYESERKSGNTMYEAEL